MRVFVTVGNAVDPFDRLLRMVDRALPEGWEGVCQVGVSAVRPARLECRAQISRGEFEREMAGADVVVSHAGVGTIATALRQGHVPIVVPRRASEREHLNDHQLEIANELARDGRILIVEDVDGLRSALARYERGEIRRGPGTILDTTALRNIAGVLEEPRRTRPSALQALGLRVLSAAAPMPTRLRVK